MTKSFHADASAPDVSADAARPSILRRLLDPAPTLSVIALIALLGWWGHKHDWKLPKFSELFGEREKPDDWCDEHFVPESECILCHPDLLPAPKPFGWCTEHGVHECVLCHPERAQTQEPAVVADDDRLRARRALELKKRPDNNSLCKLHERRIQFASAAAVDKAGIEPDPVRRQAQLVETLAVFGELNFDATKQAQVGPRSSGSVWRVFRHLGDPVKQGDVLALVDAGEVGKAKAEFLHALAQHEQKKRLYDGLKGSSVAERTIMEAEAAFKEARIRVATARQALVNLGLTVDLDDFQNLTDEQAHKKVQFAGLPYEVIRLLDPKTATANLLPVVAPLDGVVTSRDVVAGEIVDSTKVMFRIVDPRTMWLTLNIRLEDAPLVHVGQKVHFVPDGRTEKLTGTLDWLSAEADHKTRTVRARVTLPNLDGKLRANLFGAGEIVLREEKNVIVVPNEAVHFEGDCYVVFVRDKDYFRDGSWKVFHTRSVRIGVRTDSHTEIIAGVLPGEVVASKGSGALRSELLRSELGAGCCHVHEKGEKK